MKDHSRASITHQRNHDGSGLRSSRGGVFSVLGSDEGHHIAHAAFGLIAAFIAYSLLTSWHIDPIVSLVFTVPFLFLASALLYRVLIVPITKAKEVIVSSMILTFGVAIILEN